MSNTSKGVFQLENGYWGYRYTYHDNGKRKDVKKTRDKNGKPYKTERAVKAAREEAVFRQKIKVSEKNEVRVTFADVYEEYCANGRSGKATAQLKNKIHCGIIISILNLESG